jgi:hypothetical protein
LVSVELALLDSASFFDSVDFSDEEVRLEPEGERWSVE